MLSIIWGCAAAVSLIFIRICCIHVPVHLNAGVYLGHFTSGYVSFRYWLHNVSSPDAPGSPILNYGSENILAVRVDALSEQEGW